LARGDAFTDTHIFIAAGTNVDIVPAAGVEVMITVILGHGSALYLRGKDSAGNITGNLEVGTFGGATTPTSDLGQFGIRQTKLFITNSEFINLMASGSDFTCAVFGVQTK